MLRVRTTHHLIKQIYCGRSSRITFEDGGHCEELHFLDVSHEVARIFSDFRKYGYIVFWVNGSDTRIFLVQELYSPFPFTLDNSLPVLSSFGY